MHNAVLYANTRARDWACNQLCSLQLKVKSWYPINASLGLAALASIKTPYH